jgi:5-methylcytosine-specific restriction endonuclease McrA
METHEMATQDPTDVASSIDEALAKGFRFFCSGEPCKNGHVAPQRVINYGCIECERAALRRRRIVARAEKAAAAPQPTCPERVISRKDAKAAGLTRYFTGFPCKNGHLDERQVSDKTCMQCDRARKSLKHGASREAARKRSEQVAAYRAKHRERILEWQKEYNRRNAEVIKAKRAAHRTVHKDRINAKVAEWAKANPEKRRAKERAREGRERGAEGTHTWADIEAMRVKQNGLCAAPGCTWRLEDGFHVDHVIPIARGGSNWPDNLQLLCPPHNQSKGARDPKDWVCDAPKLL